MKRLLFLLFLTNLSFLVVNAMTSMDCLECHSNFPETPKHSENKRLKSWFAGGRESISLKITPFSLKGSVHSKFSCTGCHQDIKNLPHPEKLNNVKCGNCHSDKETEINSGIHSSKKSPYVPSCVNCHGAHRIKSSTDSTSITYPGNVHRLCGACHGNLEFMKSLGVKIANPYKNYLLSDHGKALSEGISIKVPTCPFCHGSHKILPSSDSKSPIYKQNVPDTCGKCHKSIELIFKKSTHGIALVAGNLESPSCTNCHGEHDIEAPERPTSTVYPTNIAKTTCPQCHGSVRLSERYSLPSSRVKSYQSSYHGIASIYGDTAVANCASCHGVHNILPSSNPKSEINENNLVTTCGKCHPDASLSFAKTRIHENAELTESRILFWIRWFYLLIIAVTVGLLGLHNLLDLIKRYRKTLIELKPVATYLRMSFSERIQHLTLLLTFFLLVITGFALKFPYSFWTLPFRLIPKGFELRGLIHRIAGIILVIDAIFHLCYLAFTKRGRHLLSDMLPDLKDIYDATIQVRWLSGFSKHHAQFRRFSYVEKLEYIALIWGTIIMAATGFILWFKTWAMQYLPTWGYPASEIIHFYEAILAFTTIIIWHLFSVFLHTDKPPFNPIWLTGYATEESMKEEHPVEINEMRVDK